MRAVGTPIIVTPDGPRQLEHIGLGPDTGYDERWLQELLFENPDLLPMDQIEPGLDPLISVCMELPLRSGFLDNLFVTPDGDIVIVEVKLWRNPEMRRAVLSQALNYAADLFAMTYSELDSAVGKTQGARRQTLYGVAERPEALEEAQFIDAAAHSLGRAVSSSWWSETASAVS